MPVGARPAEPGALTDEEQADLADMAQFTRQESAYANEQGTKPQTLGVGLNDSPAGLLAWIVEKFRAWSDCDGHPENCFSREQLLTNVMLYWMTQTATSSAQLYWETNQSGVLTETAALHRGTHRGGPVPEGGAALAAVVGGAAVQRHPLGGHAPGRPLRRHGAARAVRRRPGGVLPDGALSDRRRVAEAPAGPAA